MPIVEPMLQQRCERHGLREPRAAASRGIIMPLGSRAGLQEAFATLAFWLLTVGFFVCGFT